MEEQQDPSPDPTAGLESSLPFKKRTQVEEEEEEEEAAPALERPDPKMRRKDRMEITRNKTEKIKEIQNQAYVGVLRAFAAESVKVSGEKISVLKDLMKELKVTFQQHKDYMKDIENDPMLKDLRVDSSKTEEEEEETPSSKAKSTGLSSRLKKVLPLITKSREEPTTPRDSHGKGTTASASASASANRGRVLPESLIGRVVYVRLPGDDDYIQFTITNYDAKQELYALRSEKNIIDDPCTWVDLRHIPSQDIMWQGRDPGICEESCSLKPGQTILRETSTTIREGYDDHCFKIPPLPSKDATSKEPLEEVSKVTSIAPGNLETGKGILRDNEENAVEKISNLSLKDEDKSGPLQTEPCGTTATATATATAGKPDDGEGDTSNSSQNLDVEMTTA